MAVCLQAELGLEALAVHRTAVAHHHQTTHQAEHQKVDDRLAACRMAVYLAEACLEVACLEAYQMAAVEVDQRQTEAAQTLVVDHLDEGHRMVVAREHPCHHRMVGGQRADRMEACQTVADACQTVAAVHEDQMVGDRQTEPMGPRMAIFQMVVELQASRLYQALLAVPLQR